MWRFSVSNQSNGLSLGSISSWAHRWNLSIWNFGSGAHMGPRLGGLKRLRENYFWFGAHSYISSIQVDSYAVPAWYCVIFWWVILIPKTFQLFVNGSLRAGASLIRNMPSTLWARASAKKIRNGVWISWKGALWLCGTEGFTWIHVNGHWSSLFLDGKGG